MGTNTVKKLAVYLVVAIVIGVLVTVVPLIAVAEIGNFDQKYDGLRSMWLRESMGLLEGSYDTGASKSYWSDFGVLTVSFVIALALYLYVKHRMPNRDYVWVRFPPY